MRKRLLPRVRSLRIFISNICKTGERVSDISWLTVFRSGGRLDRSADGCSVLYPSVSTGAVLTWHNPDRYFSPTRLYVQLTGHSNMSERISLFTQRGFLKIIKSRHPSMLFCRPEAVSGPTSTSIVYSCRLGRKCTYLDRCARDGPAARARAPACHCMNVAAHSRGFTTDTTPRNQICFLLFV